MPSSRFPKHDHGRFAAAFEERTGKCPECYGSEEVVDFIYATRSSGRHSQVLVRKPCPRCLRRKVASHA